jgi:hypothetical protein
MLRQRSALESLYWIKGLQTRVTKKYLFLMAQAQIKPKTLKTAAQRSHKTLIRDDDLTKTHRVLSNRATNLLQKLAT